MPLAQIAYISSSSGGFDQWAMHHDLEHRSIVRAINAQRNGSLQMYVIYPVSENDRQGWLLRHQQYHNDMNAVLGYPGSDLESVNFDDEQERAIWLTLHYMEHQNAVQSLQDVE